jgi:hypothetical protein
MRSKNLSSLHTLSPEGNTFLYQQRPLKLLNTSSLQGRERESSDLIYNQAPESSLGFKTVGCRQGSIETTPFRRQLPKKAKPTTPPGGRRRGTHPCQALAARNDGAGRAAWPLRLLPRAPSPPLSPHQRQGSPFHRSRSKPTIDFTHLLFLPNLLDSSWKKWY